LESTIGLEDEISSPEKYKEKHDKRLDVGKTKLTQTLYDRMKLNRVYFMIHFEAACKAIIKTWRTDSTIKKKAVRLVGQHHFDSDISSTNIWGE